MRVLGLILVLLIGAAAGAGGTWWTLGRKPTVTLVGATKPVTCPDPDPIYPNGMVTTPEKAAAIAELVDYSNNRDPDARWRCGTGGASGRFAAGLRGGTGAAATPSGSPSATGEPNWSRSHNS